MTTYLVGQTLTFGLVVKDESGVPADLGGGIPEATITRPDGTTVSAAVAKIATGTYKATAAAAQAGRHRALWTGSGTNSGGLPYADLADVWPADPRFILSLADARAALNLPSAAMADDDELLLYIAATTSVIEDITGPILTATRIETFDGWLAAGPALHLYSYPTTITSVTEDGVTLTSDGYKLGSGGVLWRGLGRSWSTREPANITVTFTVGDGTVPANVVLAAREELRHLWQVGQVAARPALGGDQAPGTYTPTGFAVPRRVIELLADQIGARRPVGMD